MSTTLNLRVEAADGTPASVDRLAALLLADLRALRQVRVDRPAAPAPAGSKAGWAQTVGELAVHGAVPTTAYAVYRTVAAFLDRTKAKSVRYRIGDRELEVTALTAAELEKVFGQLINDADERD